MAYQPASYLPSTGYNIQYPLYPSEYSGQQPVNSITSVTGIDGAKAYKLPPSSIVALFDRDDDVFYLKATDDAGFATIRTFKFEEVPDPSMPSSESFVSRTEFDQLSAKLDKLMAELGEHGGHDGE